jgi:Guanylylate cyclase
MDALCHDERRVRELFMTAPATGIVLSQRSVPLCELARTVGGGTALAVLLVDLRKIDPWQAAADRAWNLTTGVTSATAYIGHYLLLVGYEGCLTTTGQQQQQHSEEQLELNQQQQQQMHVLGSQRLTPPCSNPSSGRPPPGAPSAPESVPEATVRSRDLGHFWAHDPALTHGPVRIPAALLESARKSFGTDEDVLILQQPGLGREPPILLGARAGLYTR